jgi:hypothetical protein
MCSFRNHATKGCTATNTSTKTAQAQGDGRKKETAEGYFFASTSIGQKSIGCHGDKYSRHPKTYNQTWASTKKG